MISEPKTFSEAIDLALVDLEKVEADPRYTVDMATWHDSRQDVCAVCLAGAVMAKSLDAPLLGDDAIMPGYFDGDWPDILRALDYLHRGAVLAAALVWHKGLGELHDAGRFDRIITSPSIDPSHFKEEMRQLSADLREAGA